jgi:hypothetical protein
MVTEGRGSLRSVAAPCWWVLLASCVESWLIGADGVLTPAQSLLGAIQGYITQCIGSILFSLANEKLESLL